jgi:TatD DNase family protein
VSTFVDTHAHLDDEQLAGDLADVLARARSAGVAQVVAVATTVPSTQASIDLAMQHPQVFATAGIHPNEIARAAPSAWDDVCRLAEHARVVAIGETGLDRHWDTTPFPVQIDYFARHLELGRKLNRPVVIHCREAEGDVLRMLRAAFEQHGPIRGVMHSFTGDAVLAEACLGMGLYLSFAGMLTYKNAAALRETARTVPLDRLLIETDSPYLSPMPLRGRRNEPAHVIHTAACLAAVQGVPLDKLAEQTTLNARALFGLP